MYQSMMSTKMETKKKMKTKRANPKANQMEMRVSVHKVLLSKFLSKQSKRLLLFQSPHHQNGKFKTRKSRASTGPQWSWSPLFPRPSWNFWRAKIFLWLSFLFWGWILLNCSFDWVIKCNYRRDLVACPKPWGLFCSSTPFWRDLSYSSYAPGLFCSRYFFLNNFRGCLWSKSSGKDGN